MRLMPEYSSEICPVISGVCSVSVCSSTHSYLVPSWASIGSVASISPMRGTLVNVHGSSVSRVATSSLVTAFFAPAERTSPRIGEPPVMRQRSSWLESATTARSEGGATAESSGSVIAMTSRLLLRGFATSQRAE